MYSYDDNDQSPAQRAASDGARSAHGCGSISTERIMQAVEEQRRVSQQLEDLRLQQKQRTAHLRIAGLKLMGVCWCLFVMALCGFLFLLTIQPVLFERLMDALSDKIALVVLLTEQIQANLAFVPAGNWLVSAAALVVVLMMGLWIRLMRHPQDA